MKSIGQFAKENHVTIKTLHYYEKLELILPKKVDSETGYRYYSGENSNELRLVLFMKDLGFSLSEIKGVMEESLNVATLIDVLDVKVSQSRKELDHTSRRMYRLGKLIDILNEKPNDTVNLKELIALSEQELYTGKYGHGTFIEESKNAFEKAKLHNTPISLIQLDLDDFHELNMTFGHDIGDIVLERTGEALKQVLSEGKISGFMERKGGDEYSVLVHLNTMEASLLAASLCKRVVETDYSDVSEDLKVSITAGIAGLTKRTKSYTELFHNATIALYEQKKNR